MLALGIVVIMGTRRLQSLSEIAKDGPTPGGRAPRVVARSLTGSTWTVPSGRWELLLFGDHSLVEFPDVVSGVDDMTREGCSVTVLSRRAALTTAVLEEMSVPLNVGQVKQRDYDRYRVRVMPFLVVVDPEGRVRRGGLVNTAQQVQTIWKASRVSGALNPESVGKSVSEAVR